MKKFLASVGNAQLFARKADNTLRHIADIRTLTESTLSFSTTMEEIRAGEGAKLYGRFSHDSGMSVTLTDAMFDLEYIALQVGSEKDDGNYSTDTLESFEANEIVSGKVAVKKQPQPLGLACGLDKTMAWVKAKGCNDSEWVSTDEISGQEVTIPSGVDTTNGVCVRYFALAAGHRTTVNANFIPGECVLLLKTKLFAGSADNIETGKAVGSITVKIPRFQLDGQFDLSMAMSSAATISLNGTALAVEDGSCEGNGIYAEIIEVDESDSMSKGLQMIAFDNEVNKVGETPVVYGLYTNGHTGLLDNADITFSPVLSNGKFSTTGSTTATYNNKTDTITVEAAE